MNATLTTTKIEPYLQFGGRCEEALEFYRQALDGQVEMLMRFKDAPDGPCEGAPEMDGNQIMHGSVRIGETTLMATDFGCMEGGGSGFGGFSLSLSAADEAQARKYFNALAEGGTVHAPLNKTFFSPCFGVVQDKFGVNWMVIVPA